MRLHLAPLLLLITAAPALSQEVLGTIEARVDDTFRTWHLTRDGDQNQSRWAEMMRGLTDVSLWGHDSPDSATSVAGAMILDFGVMTTTGTPVVVNPTLQYLTEGYKGGWLATDDSQIAVTLETFDATAAGLKITGSFTATLTYSTDPMTQTMDPTRSQTIEGRFDATLPKD